MSNTQPTPKTQRTRNSRKENSKPARAKTTSTSVLVSSEQRQSMIAESAYLRAEQRGFCGGDPVVDWLESEKEVDELLSRSSH